MPSDIDHGIASLGPPAAAQARLLGLGVAPPSRRPWPGVRLLLPATAPDLGRGVALLIATPDLGRRVAPLICSCTIAAWHSRPLPLTLDVG